MKNSDNKNLRILRRKEVEEKTGLARSTIYSWMKREEGAFPKPIRLGARSVGWLEEEIDAWLDERLKSRDNCEEIDKRCPETQQGTETEDDECKEHV